jgi:prepilin-type N-terminal cleavage/methylation domain-containing protein
MNISLGVSRGDAGGMLASTVAKDCTPMAAPKATRAMADKPNAPPHVRTTRPALGFTLLELLAVIALIGLLAALLFPGIRSVRVAANKARTRVQFNQWAAALEGFRSEYGCYPALHSSNLVNPPGQNTDAGSLHLFHDILAARRRDGTALPAYGPGTDSQFPEAQNRKLISFFLFSDSDLATNNLLRDAFDNTEIAVLVDRNLDGIINAADYGGSLPVVGGMTPGSADFPATGIRAGVVFYAPAPDGNAANPGFIFSWR